MKINNILKKCTTNYITKNLKNSDVKGISFHSREIKKNYIFAAVKGFENNGEKYVKDIFKIEDIILIVSFSFKIIKIYKEIPIIKTKNVRKLAGEMASIIYPNKIDDKIAVTGTNGKTSIAHYISEISSHQNISNCTLGTLGVIFNKKKIFNTSLTTNDSVNNHKILNKLSNKGCKRVIFEASSIGLHQNRLQNIKFNKIAISNLTVDHLDYHKNFLNYKQSKSILFKENFYKKTSAIINADLKDFKFFRDLSREKGLEILDYGKNANFFKFINFKKKAKYYRSQLLTKQKKGVCKILLLC